MRAGARAMPIGRPRCGRHEARGGLKLAMRILTLIGTRPEAIKLAPVVKALESRPELMSIVCATGQHGDLVEPILTWFGIRPAERVSTMVDNQPLNQLFAKLLREIDGVIERTAPDFVVVQGDTSTAAAGALAAFHRGVRVGHVEAGLRTGNLAQPWPEEMNRKLVDMVADLLFAPTERARASLLAEGVSAEKIEVTGNTVVDALLMTAAHIERDRKLAQALCARHHRYLEHGQLVLVTAHRRESFGAPIAAICDAIKTIARERSRCVVYPVHPNPNVRKPVHDSLSGLDNVFLVDPLDYVDLVFLMQRAAVILTDSGGIQEEAPTFGVPVLVMREVTERPEAVEAGVARIVGRDPETIVAAVDAALRQRRQGSQASRPANPFGDGHAAERIAARIAAC
jgi:UDP-N-acetylglucosamine 2-epimerase (non-hydrolysing)